MRESQPQRPDYHALAVRQSMLNFLAVHCYPYRAVESDPVAVEVESVCRDKSGREMAEWVAARSLSELQIILGY